MFIILYLNNVSVGFRGRFSGWRLLRAPPAILVKQNSPPRLILGEKMQVCLAGSRKGAQKCSSHGVTVEGMTERENNCKEKQAGILLLRKNSSQQGKANAFRIRFSASHPAEQQQPGLKC